MNDYACHFCGTVAGETNTHCANCASELRFELGNPYVGERPTQKKLVAILGSALAISLTFTGVMFGLGVSQAGAAFAAGFGFGNSSVGDAFNFLDANDWSAGDSSGSDSGSGSDNGSDSGTDWGTGGGTDAGTETDTGSDSGYYTLSAAQEADGLVLWGATPVAWRWATAAEDENLTCSSETCVFMYVETVDSCQALEVSANITDAENNGNWLNFGWGYGNNDEFGNYVAGNESQFIEVGTSDSWTDQVWFDIDEITCD